MSAPVKSKGSRQSPSRWTKSTKPAPAISVKVTLEITAGQGSNLGYRFEQIGDMIDATKENERLRVCFDTEHAFAAGYDIRTKEGYERTFAEFDKTIGISCSRRFI